MQHLLIAPFLPINLKNSILDSIQNCYEAAFPDLNERENFSAVWKRCRHSSLRTPEPGTMMFVLLDDSDQFIGALMADYYNTNDFLHLIYLFVHPNHRKSGLGSILLHEGVTRMRHACKDVKKELKHVVLEANIPWRTIQDSFNPDIRLHFFRKNNVQWINIPYVQPQLCNKSERVSHLFLLYFPTRPNVCLHRDELKDFLLDLYQGLGVMHPEKDLDILEMFEKINQICSEQLLIPMSTIPEMESHSLLIRNASISYQLAIQQPQDADKESFCPYFHSYETDLFSFRYQKNKPFRTRFLKDHGTIDIHIHFPETYTYFSEGKNFTKQSFRHNVKAKIHLSITHFKEGGIAILQCVVSSIEDEGFYENELIKLSNFFGSKQENVDLRDQIRFSFSDSDETHLLVSFLEQALSQSISRFVLHTGVIQFDTASIHFETSLPSDPFEWSEVYNQLRFAQAGNEEQLLEFEHNYQNNSAFQLICNALCGFSLGIFDFNRMGFDEIIDTLIPKRAGESFFIMLNRGVLLNMCHEDELFAATKENVGLSPYLLIPNTVLAYNDCILELADKKVHKLKESRKAGGSISVEHLRKIRKQIDVILHTWFLPNVFQYPTEKELYDYGLSHRGIDEQKISLKEVKTEIDALIEEKESERASRHELFMTILLTIISCFQLQGIFQSLADGNQMKSWIYTALFSFSVAGTIFYVNRIRKK
jgi:GNAT superfamily N-acetyltransferase